MPRREGTYGNFLREGDRKAPFPLVSSETDAAGKCRKPSKSARAKHARTPKRNGKSAASVAAAVFLLIVGVALLAYPSVSDVLSQAERDKVATSQQAAVEHLEETDPNALQDELDRAEAYNERLAQGLVVITDPFDERAKTLSDQEYLDTLNVNGDGVMATLVIPCIGAELPIYHTTDDDVLQKGVGHMPGTALPIGGASTHSVLAGHTGLPSTKIFDSLDQVQLGDYFLIEVLGEVHAYRVDDISVVLPDETDGLAVVPDEDLITLVTCTPYGINSHRLLVRGTRCEVPDGWLDNSGSLSRDALSSGEQRTSPEIAKNALLGVGLGAGIVAVGALATWGARRARGQRNAASVRGSAGKHARGKMRRRERGREGKQACDGNRGRGEQDCGSDRNQSGREQGHEDKRILQPFGNGLLPSDRNHSRKRGRHAKKR